MYFNVTQIIKMLRLFYFLLSFCLKIITPDNIFLKTLEIEDNLLRIFGEITK